MSETNGNSGQNNGGNGQAEGGKRLEMRNVYVKDLSFELPTAPAIFFNRALATEQPKMEVNLGNKFSELPENHHEIVLTIRIHSKLPDDTTLFLLELEQAGIFIVDGYEQEEKARLFHTDCLQSLFPFVRETVWNTISKGGVPALMLQPMDFGKLYEDAVTERAKTADAGAPPTN